MEHSNSEVDIKKPKKVKNQNRENKNRTVKRKMNRNQAHIEIKRNLKIKTKTKQGRTIAFPGETLLCPNQTSNQVHPRQENIIRLITINGPKIIKIIHGPGDAENIEDTQEITETIEVNPEAVDPTAKMAQETSIEANQGNGLQGLTILHLKKT